MNEANKQMLEKYPQYYKDVSHLAVIDVYRVLDLFGVTDPTAQHAVKKLLLSGTRTGGKSIEQDLREAMHTIQRGLAMREEDTRQGELKFAYLGTNHDISHPSPEVLQELKKDLGKLLIPDPMVASQQVAEMLNDGMPKSGEEYVLDSITKEPTTPCSVGGCEMRARDGDRCMIHREPQPAKPHTTPGPTRPPVPHP